MPLPPAKPPNLHLDTAKLTTQPTPESNSERLKFRSTKNTKRYLAQASPNKKKPNGVVRFDKSDTSLRFFLPIALDIVRFKVVHDAPKVPETTPSHYPLASLPVCSE